MWQRSSDSSNHALTLKLEAYGDDTPASSSPEESNHESDLEEDNVPVQCNNRRKRKRSEEENDEDSDESGNTESDMPEVVHQMEAEIERQLDDKAKKSNLTVANVKNIIKSVITNEHVLELVRHTMQQPERNVCINTVLSFSPKLTRSKTKELLNTFPSMAWPLTPCKTMSNSKCKVLIEEELPEDSSDEEYHPEDDQEDTDYLKSESDFYNDGDDDDDDEEEEEEEQESDDIDHYDEDAEDDSEDVGEGNDSGHESGHDTSCVSDASKINSTLNSSGNRGNDADVYEYDDDDDDCRLVICDTENDVIEASGLDNDVKAAMSSSKPSEKTLVDIPETAVRELKTRSNEISVHEEPVNEEGNICQRTRSKLCLSDTPLEIIESAFMPPDITTDMYDSECDDENWKNFLKRFTEPLKHNVLGGPDDEDDEEMDPEYNIMAEDEETEDKEELREDPDVMVSHTEVHALMAELFEYSGMIFDDTESKKKSNLRETGHIFQNRSMDDDELDDIAQQIAGVLEQHAEVTKLEKPLTQQSHSEKYPLSTSTAHLPTALPTLSSGNEISSFCSVPKIENFRKTDNTFPNSSKIPCEMSTDQKLLLGQQLRKHIQLLTQHYLLAFLHPMYHVHAMDCKQYLTFLKIRTQNDKSSAYYVENLDESLALIEKWEEAHSSEEAKELYVRFIESEIESYSIYKKKKLFYKGKFPAELCEVIINSSVFLYPSLLPVSPFRSDSTGTPAFFPSEDSLIALGLELFSNLAKENPKLWGNTTLYRSVPRVIEHFTPVRKHSTVYNHILDCSKKSSDNPIKYYLQNGCVKKTIHYVIPYVVLKPPKSMPHELLPDAWKNYLLSKNLNKITDTA